MESVTTEHAYSPRRPPPDLAEVVVCRWDARMDPGPHLMVPDGCVEIMWLEGRGLLVCGPETRAWPVHHNDSVAASGVRLRPGVAAAALGLPMSTLTDRRAALADVVAKRHLDGLSARLDDTAPTTRSELLLALVRSLLVDTDETALVSSTARSLIERSDGLDDLARSMGVTTRTLHRRCTRDFGYGPSTLRSILRLQRALAWRKSNPELRLADVAAHAGYVDQAHLAKDTRLRAGLTPRQLFGSPSADWHGAGAVVRV